MFYEGSVGVGNGLRVAAGMETLVGVAVGVVVAMLGGVAVGVLVGVGVGVAATTVMVAFIVVG